MLRYVFATLVLCSNLCFAAQGSGIFIEAHASQGDMVGDTLYYFRGTMNAPAGRIGMLDHDTLRTISNGKVISEFAGKDTILFLRKDHPVNFQYAVQPSFTIGYEHSFNKVLSVRGSVGYLSSNLDVISSQVISYKIDPVTNRGVDTVYDPAADAEISSHWLSLPLDIKIMIPIRRSGIYAALGPKTMLLLASKYTDNLNDSTFDLTALTPRFNFLLGVRLGGEIAIANIGFLLLEAGYHAGMTEMSIIPQMSSKMGERTLFSGAFRFKLP